MKPPSQERSRRTLDRLMTAAVRSFADEGVDRATVAEIVRNAKSSVGSFYGRFASKDELVAAVDARLWGEVEERWRSALLELAGAGSAGIDPATDTLTDLTISIVGSSGPSMLDLSRAVFDALAPDLEARTRASAYLERKAVTPGGVRVLARIEADVLRTLRAARAPRPASSPGMSEFLTGVVLKTATDPNAGSDAPLHLAHVLTASMGAKSLWGRPLPVELDPTPGVEPESGRIASAREPEPPDVAALRPAPGIEPEPGVEPAPDTAPEPGIVPEPEERSRPEAFDIWA